MSKKIIAAAIVLLVAAGTWLGAEEKLPKPATKEAAKLMEKAAKAVKNRPGRRPRHLCRSSEAGADIRAGVPDRGPGLSPETGRRERPRLPGESRKGGPGIRPRRRRLRASARGKSPSGRHSGKPAEAIPYLTRLIAIPGLETSRKPLYIDGLFNMGVSAFQARQFEDSVEAFTKLLAVPDVATVAKPSFVLARYMKWVQPQSSRKARGRQRLPA